MIINNIIKDIPKEINSLRMKWNLNYTLKSLGALALIVAGVALIILGSLLSTGIGLVILGGFLLYRQIRACQQTHTLVTLAKKSIDVLARKKA